MTTPRLLVPALRLTLSSLLLLACAVAPAAAATCTWVGTGVNNNFSHAGNWSAVPASGDDMVFPANVWSTTNLPVNDLTGLVINALNIYEQYTITGNEIHLRIINVNNAGITNVAVPLTTVGSAVLTITVLDATGLLNLSGLISGAGPVTYGGPGAKRLNGTLDNTLSGLTSVALGTLVLDSAASEAIAGPLTINTGAIVSLINAPDIKNTVVVTASGTFDLSAADGSEGSNTETIGGLAGVGTVNLGSKTLGCVGQSAPTNFSGGFQGTGSFRQSGNGVQVLSGTSVPYSGTVRLAGGEIHVWGNQIASPISVTSGRLVLANDCTVGAVTLSGGSASTLAFTTLSAMALHGIVAPTLTIGSGCRYLVDVNPTTNGYVTSPSVTITGATLVVDTSLFTPTITSVMTIIEKSGSGAITGTFAGLAEGATVTSSTNSGTTFSITYVGGSGSNDVRLTCTAIASDTTAPVISSIAAGTLTPASGTVTWTTNEAATTQVEYGLTTAYGDTTTRDATLVTSHSAVIPRLAPATTYHYRVLSADAAGNLRISSDQTFATAATSGTAPVISAVSVTATTTMATVTWTTSEVCDSQVEYGETAAYGTVTTLDAAMVTSHSVQITGLVAGTEHHLRVFSGDASANVAASADEEFTTTGSSVPGASSNGGKKKSHSCGLGGLASVSMVLGLLLIARRRD